MVSNNQSINQSINSTFKHGKNSSGWYSIKDNLVDIFPFTCNIYLRGLLKVLTLLLLNYTELDLLSMNAVYLP